MVPKGYDNAPDPRPSPPRHIYKKGKAAWYRLSPESRQAIIDRYNKKKASMEEVKALRMKRAKEAAVNGLSPEAEAKWRELREGKDPNEGLPSASPVTARSAETSNVEVCPTGGNRCEEEEGKRNQDSILPYKSYDQRMVSTAPRDCDLSQTIELRLKVMSNYRNNCWE
ncbi:MAG: hypothetical protein LBC03_03590 [Nitrososphaerota archaeon]|jgi:hypothetical protein|nr:hypothetical protein [Nitrososphaerota archaeon]